MHGLPLTSSFQCTARGKRRWRQRSPPVFSKPIPLTELSLLTMDPLKRFVYRSVHTLLPRFRSCVFRRIGEFPPPETRGSLIQVLLSSRASTRKSSQPRIGSLPV